MKFSNEQASILGLIVTGKDPSKPGTALAHPTFGFAGRRIYVDRTPPFAEYRVKPEEGVEKQEAQLSIHLSGFTPDEAELLGATPNQRVLNKKTGKMEYFASARISGFLEFNAQNLTQAAELLLQATGSAWERSGEVKVSTRYEEADSVFATIAASKS